MRDPQTTLFYVDDDTDDLEFFKEVAESIGVPVFLFDNGNALIRQIYNPPPKPSIVFLDLNMPGKSGFDIISELKQSQFSHIPLVVFSTAGDPLAVDQCRKLGANMYIKKGNCLKDLKKAIEFTIEVDWDNFNPDGSEFLYKN